MSDDQKIDFAALDPSRDKVRWEEMVGQVALRAMERRRRPSVARQLAVWARPTLAAVAVLAVLIWALVWLRPPSQTTAAMATTPSSQLAQWAQNDELPETTTILEILGDDHGPR